MFLIPTASEVTLDNLIASLLPTVSVIASVQGLPDDDETRTFQIALVCCEYYIIHVDLHLMVSDFYHADI